MNSKEISTSKQIQLAANNYLRIFFIFLLLAVAITLNAAELYKTTADVNLRSGKGTKFNSIGIVKKGEIVIVLKQDNALWFKVEYKGKNGFLSSKLLTLVVVEPIKGETNTSMYFIIGLVVVIVVLVYAFVGKNKTTKPLNTDTNKKQKSEKELKEELIEQILSNIKITVTTSNLTNSSKDDSIIDVTGETYNINTSVNLIKYSNGVPYWAHKNVYSYSEINNATAEQKKFYSIFKNSFLNGDYFNLEGNTNYAFILVFEFLSEYENHKDIFKLKDELKVLGQYYSVTKSIGEYYLNSYTFEEYFKLGLKYKDKLKLKELEVKLLDSLIDTNNKFNSIEFCAIELIGLLFNCKEHLEEYYKQNNYKFEYLINEISHIEITDQYKYKLGSYNYKSISDNFSTTVYQCIYKTCENSLRDFLKVGRKTDLSWYLHSENSINLFNEKVLNVIHPFIDLNIAKIKELDIESEIKINNYSRSRYKNELKALNETFDLANKSVYNDAIVDLELRNQGNPFIENIYFEASKFVSKYDKSLSLSYYIKYLYHDLKSVNFDYKQFTKTIQKNLFNTNEQLRDFEIVVSELIKDKNLENALQGVSKIYTSKRKKIKLDTTSIIEVQQQHSGTVELLNEYLKDEYDDANNTIKTQEINSEEVIIEIIQKTDEAHQSIYISDIAFTQIHTTALEIFAKSNFSVSQSEFETFAKSNGVFKNQLIERINELCYENLGDVLIEEEEEYYTINPKYYQRLLTK